MVKAELSLGLRKYHTIKYPVLNQAPRHEDVYYTKLTVMP
jgi:hypothetical protein